jgi:hypothetical protein
MPGMGCSGPVSDKRTYQALAFALTGCIIPAENRFTLVDYQMCKELPKGLLGKLVAHTAELQAAAAVATVMGAIIATGALCFGVYEFNETQNLTQQNLNNQAVTLKQERETKAYELFLEFNEKQQELAVKPPPHKGEAAFWRYNALLSMTEAVFRLTKGDAGWEETVSSMLEVQRPFLQTGIYCKTWAEDFVERMKKVEPSLRCTQE